MNGRPVELTTYEYRLLENFMLAPATCSRAPELAERMYAEEDVDRDSNIIEVYVGRLRKKLDPDDTIKPLETVRGRGYRLALTPGRRATILVTIPATLRPIAPRRALLSRRLLLSVSVSMVAFFGVTLFALDAIFQNLSERAMRDLLDAQIVALIAAAEPQSDGNFEPAGRAIETRLETPGSGLYAQIQSTQAGDVPWRSPSAAGTFIDFGPPIAAGANSFTYARSPQEEIAIASRGISFEDESHVKRNLTFSVATSLTPYRTQLWSLRSQLVRRLLRSRHRAARDARRAAALGALAGATAGERDQRGGRGHAREAGRRLSPRAQRRDDQPQHAAARRTQSAEALPGHARQSRAWLEDAAGRDEVEPVIGAARSRRRPSISSSDAWWTSSNTSSRAQRPAAHCWVRRRSMSSLCCGTRARRC